MTFLMSYEMAPAPPTCNKAVSPRVYERKFILQLLHSALPPKAHFHFIIQNVFILFPSI